MIKTITEGIFVVIKSTPPAPLSPSPSHPPSPAELPDQFPVSTLSVTKRIPCMVHTNTHALSSNAHTNARRIRYLALIAHPASYPISEGEGNPHETITL